MIYDYEIREERLEEVLYVYLDFNSEFAKLTSKEKKKKIGEIIKNFIEENKIKFTGKKIAIISGGLIIATLICQYPNFGERELKVAENYSNSVVLVQEETKEEINNEEQLPIKEKEEKYIDNNESPNKVEKASVPKKTDTKEDTTIKPSSTSTKQVTISSQKLNEPPKKEEATLIDNNIYATIKRKNGSMINLELEEYVVGVVGAEMPASFHIEALKAQSIIARTYAIKAIENGKILTDDSSTQNYKSIDELKSMWGTSFNTYYEKVKNSVAATKGKIIIYNNFPIEAVYHSTSNGKTENAEYVWGNSFPYLISVESPYDDTNKSFISDKFFTYDELSSKLGKIIDENSKFEILGYTPGNRIENISMDGNIMTGVEVRTMFGLRSADFDIKLEDNGVTFITRGYGHGVGMSQYGANGMAKSGLNYEQILKNYYPGTNISQR